MDNQKTNTVPLGGVILAKEPIEFNQNKPETILKVRNTGDRPIQVGSHYHFFEVNNALEFDRSAAFGKRLNIASTTAIRFEPGDEIEVSLIPIGGKKTVYGFNELINGWVGNVTEAERCVQKNAVKKAADLGFKTTSNE